MHLGNALSGVVNSPLEPPSTAYDQHNDQLNYGASAVHQPRAKLNATQSTYHDFESRKAFQVSTYNPERGNEGARVYVYLESSSDLTSLVAPTASLMFASRPVPAAWSRLEAGDQNACYSYSVYAIAPAFSETGSSKPKIPLRLLIHNQSGLDASSIYIGEWLYENSKQLEHCMSSKASRKRRLMTDFQILHGRQGVLCHRNNRPHHPKITDHTPIRQQAYHTHQVSTSAPCRGDTHSMEDQNSSRISEMSWMRWDHRM